MKLKNILATTLLCSVTANATPPTIILYQHGDFSGQSILIQGTTEALPVLDDQVSAIQVLSGHWKAWSGPQGTGEYMYLQPGLYDIKDLKWNDAISSIEQVYATRTPPAVEVFTHDNQSGESYAIRHPNNPDLSRLVRQPNIRKLDFHEKTSSIRVLSGQWQLCSDRFYEGKCTTIHTHHEPIEKNLSDLPIEHLGSIRRLSEAPSQHPILDEIAAVIEGDRGIQVSGHDERFKGKSWQFSTFNQLQENWLMATPKPETTFGEHPDKFDKSRMVTELYEQIRSAQQFVDITTLTPATGAYLTAIENAIADLAADPETSPDLTIRILFGNYYTAGVDAAEFLEKISQERHIPFQVHVGAIESSLTSWNHAKIIAVDGKRAIIGGDNLWENHYMRDEPVFDLSMKVEGEAVKHAHAFALYLWEYVEKPSHWRWFSPRITFDAQCATLSLGRVVSGRLDDCPTLYGEKGAYPRLTSIPTFVPTQPTIPVLSVGRFGDIVSGGDQSDHAILSLIASAEETIHFSLQSIQGPLPVPSTLFNFFWDKDLLREINNALARGVHIYMTLSNKSARIGGGDTPGTYYGDKLWVVYEKLNGLDNRTDKIRDHLHLTHLRYNDNDKYPSGRSIPNHAKTIMVDKKAFYIGSQNLYPADLTELGLIVEDKDAAESFYKQYWEPLWLYSQRTLYRP
ncbi:beta/gamma crystallin-related protein [Algicola sagamiensis]|uniref:beta/gamma crystallin-related protein n=1 Tax=Algicola sagamiensis TaxID=163869 RepID=UPI00035E6D09|nr:beta/gamma crystallin-related protein [Algicola sagamiensis]